MTANGRRHDRLPFWCRVRRHGWRPRLSTGGWRRRTCRRCYHLNVKLPEAFDV